MLIHRCDDNISEAVHAERSFEDFDADLAHMMPQALLVVHAILRHAQSHAAVCYIVLLFVAAGLQECVAVYLA